MLRALKAILPVIRRRCPRARLIVRGDSGFCREELMAFCEAEGIDYVLGLQKNAVLNRKIEGHLAMAAARRCLCGGANVREYAEFDYQSKKSWSRSRRVVAKAEMTAQGKNPRYVVTSVSQQEWAAPSLYEGLYCGRGNMENVLKQQTLDLRADRLSPHHLGSNQLRLWWAALAYLLLERLRALTLQGTKLAQATVGTIRTRLLSTVRVVGKAAQPQTRSRNSSRLTGAPSDSASRRSMANSFAVRCSSFRPRQPEQELQMLIDALRLQLPPQPPPKITAHGLLAN